MLKQEKVKTVDFSETIAACDLKVIDAQKTNRANEGL